MRKLQWKYEIQLVSTGRVRIKSLYRYMIRILSVTENLPSVSDSWISKSWLYVFFFFFNTNSKIKYFFVFVLMNKRIWGGGTQQNNYQAKKVSRRTEVSACQWFGVLIKMLKCHVFTCTLYLDSDDNKVNKKPEKWLKDRH